MSRKMLKRVILILALVLLALCGTTFALMLRQTDSLDNRFEPAVVSCEVVESYTPPTKSSIQVQNTGNIDAYLRLRLVTYWVDGDGNIVFGTATIPSFDLGENWIAGQNNTYYYVLPVAPGKFTGEFLGSTITLTENADTGKSQVIEVFADAIQSEPEDAVTGSWGVTLSDDGTIKTVPSS